MSGFAGEYTTQIWAREENYDNSVMGERTLRIVVLSDITFKKKGYRHDFKFSVFQLYAVLALCEA